MYLQNKGKDRDRFDYFLDDHSFDDITFIVSHCTMVRRKYSDRNLCQHN